MIEEAGALELAVVVLDRSSGPAQVGGQPVGADLDRTAGSAIEQEFQEPDCSVAYLHIESGGDAMATNSSSESAAAAL